MIGWQQFLEETKQMDWMEALFQTAAVPPPKAPAEVGSATPSGAVSPHAVAPPSSVSPPKQSEQPVRSAGISPARKAPSKNSILKIMEKPYEELREEHLQLGAQPKIDFVELIIKKNPNLKAIHGPLFLGFQQLQVLWLEKNEINGLPEELFTSLPKIEQLFLGSNNLSVLPPAIGNLTTLKKLHIQHNKVQMIPKTVSALTNLQAFYGHYNSILRVPLELVTLPQLKELTLQYNPLVAPPTHICAKGLDEIREWLTHEKQAIKDPNVKRRSATFAPGSKPGAVPPSNKSSLEFALDVAVLQHKGMRPYMEDRHLRNPTMLRVLGAPTEGFLYGIFDGHQGAGVAEFCAQNLPALLQKQSECALGSFDVAIKKAFAECESMCLAKILDLHIKGGSTATVMLICENTLTWGYVGDSKLVVGQAGKAVALTEDHRPNLPEEQKRIEANGGCVRILDGIARVQGVLAVSRSIGDIEMKNPLPLVSAVPDCGQMILTPREQCLILASDGVWDTLTPQQAVNIVKTKQTAKEAVDHLVKAAVESGSTDNITVVVILLHWTVDADSSSNI